MFCPKCGDEFVAGITVCPDCGVSLVAELPQDEPEGKQADEFVTVATFRNRFDASSARGGLEADGIPARVPGENIGSFGLNRTASAEMWVELKVRSSDRDRALKILRAAGQA